ncbi:MAG TPA: glycosyltransferase family 4 protein, partial [Polyangia bacterium]
TLRAEKFDLIHVHGPCDFGLPSLLYQMYRGPIVATLHSPMNSTSRWRKLAAPYYRYILRRNQAVISVSEAARAAMARYARFPSRIVPNGVDTAALAAGTPLPQFNDGVINVLMLGRLEPRNGPDIMFKALPRLLARVPNVRLLVAGEGRDGLASHQAMVPPEVRDRVVFLGAVYEERARLFASARLCVIPARSGTFSIIVLEALAAGVPVVSTPFVEGWQREPHFAPVQVCPDFTPETLADNLAEALGQDLSARAAQGRAIAADFDWSRVSRLVEGVYNDVLASSAGRRLGEWAERPTRLLAED